MKKQLKYPIFWLTIWLVIFLWTYFFISYGISFQIPDLPYSTVILDRDGKPVGEIIRDKTIRHQPLKYEDIPEFYRDALVTLEDGSFWSNNGVDISWLIRSTWNNIRAGKVIEWGSTLSSGLIRNTLWLNEKRTLSKKLLEFVYAVRLNHLYTKEEILTSYIDRVYYGYLNYGLTSASRYYFAKEPKNLTKAEQIALLILPKDPKKYNPYKESRAFKERFSLVIKTLKKEHILSDTEAENIQSEELQFNYEHDDVLPYVTDFMERSYNKWRLKTFREKCWNLEKSGVWGCDTVWAKMKSEDWWAETNRSEFSTPSAPLVSFGDESTDRQEDIQKPEILTTIDSSLTEKIDTLARNTILDLSWKDVSDYGIIILDRKTNELKTMIGGVNYHATEGQVNSTLALRQPGSTIKPFTYTLAFEKFWLKPGDMILDLPTAYKTSEWYEYDPKNYSLDYKWQITIAEALSQSINIPAVKMADKVGVENLLRFLHTAGFNSLTNDADHYWLGLTLGNGEVSLYELTRAYSIFANEWKLCDIQVVSNPSSSWGVSSCETTWESIKDDSNSLDCHASLTMTGLSTSSDFQVWQTNNCQQIASSWAVSDINLILTNRYFKLGGFPINSNLDFGDRNVFVKTGTSRNFRDNWAVGYSDNYIIWVWTGNKSGAFMKWVSGATGAGEIFSRIVYTLEPKSIEQKPVALDKNEKKYLEITSPLSWSIFSLDSHKPEKTQRIKLNFKSNYEHDAYSWLLDGKKIEDNAVLPTVGNHTITCVLLKDGELLKETKVNIEIKGNDE